MSYKITDINEEFFKGLEKDLLNAYSLNVFYRVYNNFSFEIKAQPNVVSRGQQKFVCPLSSELWDVYNYILGNYKIEYIYELLQSTCELVWHNPFLQKSTYEINWEEWKETRLGFLIHVAYQKLGLESGKDFSATNLSDLAGLSKTAISQKIPNEIHAEKEGRSWVIPNEEALKFLRGREELKEFDY